jgi:(p)ppGpp synthase/HD superfamily hydrolase
VETIAQTNVQLYNQLQREHRSAEELAQVRRAYDLARTLYSGYFQADGAPFMAHLVGVASIVARLGLTSDVVAAACLHNVYTAADFGDGRGKSATAQRRKLLENTVGQQVEIVVHSFWAMLRRQPVPIHTLKGQIDDMTPRDVQLVVMDLADTLEKCHDLGPLYYGDSESMLEYARREGSALIDVAERLGYPMLAAWLSDAFSRLLSATVSPALRPANSPQKYARQIIPRSCMRRPAVAARRRMWRLLRRLQKARSLS